MVVNDGNDPELVDALKKAVEERAELRYEEYPEPENHGEEPPGRIASALKDADVFIAPTKKSITHTQARIEATESGTRGATLPGINREIWNTALQADYSQVEKNTEKAMKAAENVEKVRIKTEKGTDLELEVDPDLFHPDTGIVHEDGDMSNLPAGEIYTGPIDAEGILVIEENDFGDEEDTGDRLIIEDAELQKVENAPENSNIVEKTREVDGGRNIAEFGFGTNPEATFIQQTLQDEKILGTVHIALGDNTFCFPEGHSRRTESDIHWDFVLKEPTVWFDNEKVLDKGKPVFLQD